MQDRVPAAELARDAVGFRNRLLGLFSPGDLAQLHPHFVRVPLTVGEVLVAPERPIENVYFLEDGVASLLTVGRANRTIEIGVCGREGMAGLPVAFGVDRSPQVTVVQVGGSALRLPADILRQTMDASSSVRSVLSHYAYCVVTQIAQTALANGRHAIPDRLARWLLMCHDRLDGNEVPLTHDFLAVMLGVHRSRVTDSLHLLEGAGAIRSRRGLIVVLDRSKLEEASGGSYGVAEQEYERLLGSR